MNLSSIQLKNITKTFNQPKKLIVFDRINLEFKKGLSYAITGNSGIGKSTLLHMASGLDEPTKGSVYFNDTAVFQMNAKKKELYTNYCLGFVFQQPYLINELSVLENVMLKGVIGGKPYNTVMQEAYFLLDQFGLYQKAVHMPCQLSGGQQQRVALARALINQPDFLFVDEPTGNLDDVTSYKIIEIILEHQKRYSMGLIISTHDTFLSEQLDYILHINHGKVTENPLHLKNSKNCNDFTAEIKI